MIIEDGTVKAPNIEEAPQQIERDNPAPWRIRLAGPRLVAHLSPFRSLMCRPAQNGAPIFHGPGRLGLAGRRSTNMQLWRRDRDDARRCSTPTERCHRRGEKVSPSVVQWVRGSRLGQLGSATILRLTAWSSQQSRSRVSAIELPDRRASYVARILRRDPDTDMR
jgi:hypothetical protein